MKRIFLCIAASLAGSFTSMRAETTDINDLNYVLYIDPMTVPKGTTETTLYVKMKNKAEAKGGFSFGIRLPETFSFATDSEGEPDIRLSTERTNSDHLDQFLVVPQDDGSVKVSASNLVGDGIIEGNDGVVAEVHILMPEKKGSFSITIYEPVVSIKYGNSTRSKQEIDEVETIIEITDGMNMVQDSHSFSQSTYDLSGRRVKDASKGINVIQKSDGTTRKVLVK